MGYKNLPSWLKGGIIGISCYILLTILLIPLGNMSGEIQFPYWMFPSFHGYIILLNVNISEWLGFITLFIISSISYFLIGSLIGLIRDKIKSSKK